MQTITLTLTPEEANLVLVALGELPYKISAPLIVNIKAQGDEQMSAQADRQNGPATAGQSNNRPTAQEGT